MARLVLLRHGESLWNRDDRFAGWVDIPLTPTGVAQARRAGRHMRRLGLAFDVCYTSVLIRATRTADLCLEAMDACSVPRVSSWELNERHYGALQGLSKSDCRRAYGEEQVRLWRRDYATRPPDCTPARTDALAREPRYAGVPVPASESLRDTELRVTRFWEGEVAPALALGRRPLVVAHGASLRALLKLLRGLSTAQMAAVEVPNGVPLLLDLDSGGRAAGVSVLQDPDDPRDGSGLS